MKPPLRSFLALLGRSANLQRCTSVSVVLALASAGAEIAVALSLVPVLASLGVGAGSDLGHFVDRLPPVAWLGLFAFAALLRAVVNWMSSIEEERGNQELVVSLQDRLFRALASAHWDTVRRITPPTITSALQTQTYDAGYGFSGLVRVIAAMLLAAGYLVTTALVLPPLLPLVVVLLVIMWSINARRNRSVFTRSVDYYDAQTELHQHYEDWVAISRIASLGVDTGRLADSFEKNARDAARHSIAFSRSAAATSITYQAAVAAAILVGVPVAWQLETPPALLAFGIVTLVRVLPRAAAIQAGYQALINAVTPVQKIEDLITRLSRDAVTRPATKKALRWQRLALTGIGVAEPMADGQSRWILKDIDLQIRQGEWIALLGPTGSGKTTLAEVILGLVRPDAGNLEIDGRNLSAALADRWRDQVAYVPQDVVLVDASIRDNLRLYVPEASDETLQAALQQAAASFVFTQLPEGLDTRAGPGGRWLSGGERQRIGIARALLQRPGLLVLDEPSAALDQQTQEQLMDALSGLDRDMSLVLITHRPELRQLADRVIHIEDGRLITP